MAPGKHPDVEKAVVMVRFPSPPQPCLLPHAHLASGLMSGFQHSGIQRHGATRCVANVWPTKWVQGHPEYQEEGAADAEVQSSSSYTWQLLC